MQTNRNRKSAGVTLEGLENRQFFSAAPVVVFAPPAFGEAAGTPMPVMFDAAFAGMRGMPLQSIQSVMGSNADNTASLVSATTATSAAAVATPGTFNGYPSSTTTVTSSASVSMETVNRAVDAGFVPTGTVQTGSPTEVSQSDAPATITSPPSTTVVVESVATAAPSAPALPDGRIAPPVALFSSEPIKSDDGAPGVNAITASLRSAEEQVACVVRLAWADIAYTNVGESIGRLATEAGQVLGSHAADAEFAAAVVMGVAGAAWWVKQTNDDVAEQATQEEHHWVETVYPRPLVG